MHEDATPGSVLVKLQLDANLPWIKHPFGSYRALILDWSIDKMYLEIQSTFRSGDFSEASHNQHPNKPWRDPQKSQTWRLSRLREILPQEIFMAYEELREQQLQDVAGMIFALWS